MEKKTWWIIFIILMIVLLYFVVVAIIEMKLKNNACKEMGFEKREYKNNFNFCKDKQGNLHFVEFECDYSFFDLYPLSCQVREISVGDVRVLK